MLLWEEDELNWFNNTCLENRARSYGWSTRDCMDTAMGYAFMLRT